MTESTTDKQKRIQRDQDALDARPTSSQPDDDTAVQAGARAQPERFPEQHLQKPGSEAELDLAPRYSAPDYRGSGKLDGFAALITGGDSGIGRAVAVLFAREGADVAIACLPVENGDAHETRRLVEAEGRRCLVLHGDVKESAWCREAVDRTVKTYGRLDVLVNDAAFQEHADRIEDLDDERFM